MEGLNPHRQLVDERAGFGPSSALVSAMSLDALGDAWTVWDHEPGNRLILAYRPDVFDGSDLPAACLPTIYVREGQQDLRHAGPQPASGTEGSWTVTLFLEPEVSDRIGSCVSFEAAMELAVETATAFSNGELDINGMYQLPREDYLERLHALIDG